MAVREDFAEDLAVIHDPETRQPFHVEQHGIDFIPESERWATPRDVFGMWAGASVQIEYLIYGAILMTFGLTFAQVVIVIVLGNLSYFVLGLCSLQGPNTGTTVFAINRAPFGPNGSRPISFFNWITQIGFEVEGLILIVGSGLVLMIKAGYLPGDPAKVVLVIVAVLIQSILPVFGHAAILKTLRLLVVPFIVLFAILLGFSIGHVNVNVVRTSGDWQSFTEALAFTIALSGLGWTENGNDYSRYCSTGTSKKALVGWVFLGTAVPEILIMTLGAVVGTFVLKIGTGAGGFLPFAHTERDPFVVRRRPSSLRRRTTLRHQQFGHVLVRCDPVGDRPAGEALPGRAHRLRHRVRHHHVGHLQRVVHRVPLGLRGHRHHLDRPLVRHLPGRLGSSPVSVRAQRVAEDGPRLPLLQERRILLAHVDRSTRGDVRGDLGAGRDLPPSDLLEPGDVPHQGCLRFRWRLQHLPRHGRRSRRVPAARHPLGAEAGGGARLVLREEGLLPA